MFNKLSDSDLDKVIGGLSYKGQEIDASKTVSELCIDYPELKSKLGFFYSTFASKTVQSLINEYGEEALQKLIDENS